LKNQIVIVLISDGMYEKDMKGYKRLWQHNI